jgi:predicted Ser/Thr protein kinase
MIILTVGIVDTRSMFQNITMESIQRQFTYSELLKITNNFQRILGKGGFGIVYRGNIDDRQVAVKMLSLSSIQGFQQFQSEASNCNSYKSFMLICMCIYIYIYIYIYMA